MRDRSWRRARRALAIVEARERARLMGLRSHDGFDVEMWIRKSAVTPQPCSGHCCGNPRAFGQGGRISELRGMQDEV